MLETLNTQGSIVGAIRLHCGPPNEIFGWPTLQPYSAPVKKQTKMLKTDGGW